MANRPMIGDRFTLTGNPEPCVIPRPYQWERGGSLPQNYLREAKKLMKKDTKQAHSLVRFFLVVLIIGGLLGLIPSVGYAIVADSFGAWVYALFTVMLVTLFLMLLLFLSRGVKAAGDAEMTALDDYNFTWRTGTLDDVVREITDISYTIEHGEQIRYQTSASVDGELISPFQMQDTWFSNVKKINSGGLPVPALKGHGRLRDGDAVVLIRVGSNTLILPQ